MAKQLGKSQPRLSPRHPNWVAGPCEPFPHFCVTHAQLPVHLRGPPTISIVICTTFQHGASTFLTRLGGGGGGGSHFLCLVRKWTLKSTGNYDLDFPFVQTCWINVLEGGGITD